MSGWDFNSREDERLWQQDDARMERKGIQPGIPILCDGMQDENNQPICEGPDVARYKVVLPGGKTFECNYCEVCANEALQYAVVMTKTGPAVRS